MALRTRNILSLCAGVGGLELGILLALHSRTEAGRGICYVEREAAAAASLVASMEGGWLHPAPVWSDMLTFDARRWRGHVHILASGDPCQENSVAGKREGKRGARFLAPEVCRIADECRPDLIFRENVPGNADGQLEAIAPALERLGYVVAAGIFSSAETGNTMRRERLFIMAVADGGNASAEWEQRGGQFGLLAQGDGASRDVDQLGGSPSPRPLPSAHPGADRGDESRGPRNAQPQRRGGAVDGSERAERRPLGEPCGAGGGDALPPGQEGPAWAGASGEGLERTQGLGRGEGRTESARKQGRCAATRAGCELAGPSDEGQQRQQRGQHHAPGRQEPRRHAGLRSGAILPPAVIPGPTDSRWIDVLDRWPEYQPALSQEEAESHLRRGVDAMAHRIERLRATGNGVDPVVAAYAFLRLDALLAEARRTGEFVLMEQAA